MAHDRVRSPGENHTPAGVKARAIAALEAMGLSASDAVRLLFHRIAADQVFPLELRVPNAETRAAMAEAEEIMRSKKSRFRNAEEVFADLDKNSAG